MIEAEMFPQAHFRGHFDHLALAVTLCKEARRITLSQDMLLVTDEAGQKTELRVSKTATLGIPHLSELVDCAKWS